MKISYLFLVMYLFLFSGCSENSTEQKQTISEKIYERNGLVDSLSGTCSTFLVRTLYMDTLDMRQYSKIRVEMNAFTDGDLSTIEIFRVNADTSVNLIYLSGSNQINSSSSVETFSPQINSGYFFRLKLYSSICTGQYFHLKVRDLKVFGLK